MSTNGEWNRDMLVCSLLKLCNQVVQIPTAAFLSPECETVSVLNGKGSAAFSNVNWIQSVSNVDKQPYSSEAGSQSSIGTDEETDESKLQGIGLAGGEQSRCLNHGTSKHIRTLADTVVRHRPTMCSLLHALTACSSNMMAHLLSSHGHGLSVQDKLALGDPISVGDCIFHILSTLNKRLVNMNVLVNVLHMFLSGQLHTPTCTFNSLTHFSEPLLWYIMTVLDCEQMLRTFVSLGGAKTLCRNLVESNQQTVSIRPGIVSAVMQCLNGKSSAGPSQNKRSSGSSELETNVDGLYNFAPLGMCFICSILQCIF